MAEMRISNTLVNDTSTGEIAYAKQLKDNTIREFINRGLTELQKSFIPQDLLSDNNHFQNYLNEFFLKHWADFQIFINTKGVEGVVDTWKDVEEFLHSIPDDDANTLLKLIGAVQEYSGQLNLRMSETIPGMLEAVSKAEEPLISNSYLDKQTGEIKIVYAFE